MDNHVVAGRYYVPGGRRSLGNGRYGLGDEQPGNVLRDGVRGTPIARIRGVTLAVFRFDPEKSDNFRV